MKSRHPSLVLAVVTALALSTQIAAAENRAASPQAEAPAPPPVPLETTRPAEPPVPPEIPEVAELRAAVEAGAAEMSETIRAQVERAARDAERQLKGLRGGISRLRSNLGETYFQGGGPNVFRSMVLPVGEEPRDMGAIKEELAIMGRLIQKSLQPESERKSNPFRFEFGGVHLGGRNDLDALYLEGYGVVFFIEVDYPLAAAPVRDPKPVEARAEKDDAWEQARREVRGEPDPEEETSGLAIFGSEAKPFDTARVDALKGRLVEVLQQARNLKCLKGAETVTFVVSGTSPEEWRLRKSRPAVASGRPAKVDGGYVIESGGPRRAEGGTVMTLRVGKGDLDLLGSGGLKPEDFGGRVRVANRLESSGESETSGNEPAKVRRPGR